MVVPPPGREPVTSLANYPLGLHNLTGSPLTNLVCSKPNNQASHINLRVVLLVFRPPAPCMQRHSFGILDWFYSICYPLRILPCLSIAYIPHCAIPPFIFAQANISPGSWYIMAVVSHEPPLSVCNLYAGRKISLAVGARPCTNHLSHMATTLKPALRDVIGTLTHQPQVLLSDIDCASGWSCPILITTLRAKGAGAPYSCRPWHRHIRCPISLCVQLRSRSEITPLVFLSLCITSPITET